MVGPGSREPDTLETVDLHELLSGKWEDGTRPRDLYERHVRHHPRRYVPAIMAGLGSNHARVASGCAELASLLSADHPEHLCQHLHSFLRNLAAPGKILRWEAVCTVGNLAAMDEASALGPHIDTMIAFLRDPSVVLQGHVARALAKIARAFPGEASRILAALQGAEGAFPGNRVGFLIEAMPPFIELGGFEESVRAFIAPHQQSKIRVVARKAARVMALLPAGSPPRRRATPRSGRRGARRTS